jgi:IS30 family transposase
MNNKYKRLTAAERLTIHEMRVSGAGVSLIAQAVGRPKGTVSKELHRHSKYHGKVWWRMSGSERARFAEEQTRRNAQRRRRKGKMNNPELQEFVLSKLTTDHFSPEAIAAKSKEWFGLQSVCTKTIYSWLKKDRTECIKYLRRRGTPYRQRISHRRGRFNRGAPTKRPISDRPTEVEYKVDIGHFEVDTVVSCKTGTGGVLGLRERATRQRHYAFIPDLKATTVLPVLRAMLLAWPAAWLKTLTFDNGVEFCTTEMRKLEGIFSGLRIYYTDSYSSWQKGSIENANGELRWYFPKGTDFAAVSPAEIRRVVAMLNNKPMKCHGWQSSQEVMQGLASALNKAVEARC